MLIFISIIAEIQTDIFLNQLTYKQVLDKYHQISYEQIFAIAEYGKDLSPSQLQVKLLFIEDGMTSSQIKKIILH